MLRLLFTLVPLLALAANTFTEPDPSQVVIIYNSLSTYDTDGNGVYDHLQILDSLESVRGTLPYVLAVRTSIDYNSESQAQTIHVDKLHYDFDTDPYGQNTDVSLPAGQDYIFQTYCQYMDDHDLWGKAIFVEFVIGMPLKVRGNDNWGYLPEYATGDSTLYRSLASYFWTFAAPGGGANGFYAGRNITKLYQANPYYTQVNSTGNWAFVPGTLKSYWMNGATPAADTMRLWIALPTLLDGNNVRDVLGMIGRSQSRIIPASGVASATRWAVFDEASQSHNYKPTQTVTGLIDTLQTIFPSQVLRDIDSVSNAGTDTVYLGWPGDITLPSGDSCALYFTAASKHATRPVTSNRWYYETDLPILPGAITWASESYSAYSIRDTSLRPPGEGTQTLACEAIEAGFTYALGNCFEPTGFGMPAAHIIANGLRIPNLPFALLASAAMGKIMGTLFSHVAVGPAIGYFRPALTGDVSTQRPLVGACGEMVVYSATMPATADSILFTIIQADGDTILPTIANGGRVNTSGGGSVNHTINSRWISEPNIRLIVTIVDNQGIYNTTAYDR